MAVCAGGPAVAQVWIEAAKLTADVGGGMDDDFGIAVSISGDVAVVGAPRVDLDVVNGGGVWTYHHTGAGWEQDGPPIQRVPVLNLFGSGVSVAGDRIAVIESNPSVQELHLYVYNGSTWTFEDEFSNPTGVPPAGQGMQAVSVSGDTVVIGAGQDVSCYGGPDDGRSWVFQSPPAWTDIELCPPENLCPQSVCRFGASVALSGDVAVIGSYVPNVAWVFRRTGGSTWDAGTKLEVVGSPQDFGFAVAVSGDTLVVGARGGDGAEVGAAYVYRYSAGSWQLDATLTARDGAMEDRFGSSIAVAENTLVGDLVVVGADQDDDLGSVYVFRYDPGSSSWVQEDKLLASDGEAGDHFGWSVDISGVDLIVGMNSDTTPGAAYIYTIDCNANGILDWDDVDPADPDGDGVVHGDYNQNVVPDECDPFITEAFWLGQGASTLFRDWTNWDPSTPGGRAVFDSDAAYTVDFDLDAATAQLEVSAGDVTFDLGGRDYDVTDRTATSVTIGGAGEPSLSIMNGTLGSVAAKLGADQATVGTMTVSGAAWLMSEDLVIGQAGRGEVRVEDAGVLSTLSIGLGVEAGSDGSRLVVDGAGSDCFVLLLAQIDRGTLEVTAGAVFDAIATVLSGRGRLLGDGTVYGDVVNFGEVQPGAVGMPGTLTVDGDYEQVEQNPGFGNFSGTLSIEIADAAHDTLAVTGEARLGGGLVVELAGADPALGAPFPILTASAIQDEFDVAFMPGLAGEKFMLVQYGGTASEGAQSATVTVTSLAALFDFDPAAPVGVGGVPTDVGVGDFDGDGDEDLAITVLGANPGDNGSVIVLLNGGFDGQTGDWIIDGNVQTVVGREPSGIAVALLDAGADLDVAVSNLGDDDVYVLRGNGNGSFDPVPVVVPVGAQPSAIAAADFDEDGNGDIDLLVANAGDNNLRVLSNNGDAAFVLQATIAAGVNPFAVDPSDLDNDKDADVAAACLGSDTLTIVVNLGAGFFAAPITRGVGDAPVDLASRDFDGNGFRDFVTANRGDDSGGAGTVSVVLNNGDGTFQPAVNLPVGDQARSLTSIDLEGDSDADIAVVVNDMVGDRIVQVLRNDLTGGQLIFADAETLAAGENPALVTTGDLDGAGSEDLITVSEDPAPLAGLGPLAAGSVRVRLNVEPCPWDCGDDDRVVGINDFLALLAQWDQGGTPCDFGLGPPGVGIDEFLAVLAAWGSCP